MAKKTKPKTSATTIVAPKKTLTWEQSKNIFLTKCTTRQELKNFIKYFFELELPDTTVSRHADTNPYDIVWEMYDICVNKNNPENIQELLYVAARGSGKTLGMAIAELLILIHDQRDCVHLGAILSQAKRCYSYQQKFLLNSKIKPIVSPPDVSDEERILGKCNMEKSTFNLTEGKVTIEVLPTTLKAVNGPHVPLVVCIGGKTKILVDNTKRNIEDSNRDRVSISASKLYTLITQGRAVDIVSFNHDLGILESKPILEAVNNGKRSRLKIERTSGKPLWCTPEHLLWDPINNVYKPAIEFKVGDAILTTNKKQLCREFLPLSTAVVPSVMPVETLDTTEQAFQVLLGSMLGDGGIYKQYSNAPRSVYYAENHGPKQNEYALWKRSVLEQTMEFNNNGKSVSGFKPDSIGIRIKSRWNTELTPFLGMKQEFDMKLLSRMGRLALAVWYMDDGHKNQFCTHSFSYKQCEQLGEVLLTNFGINTKIIQHYKKKRDKKYWVVQLATQSDYATLYSNIKAYMVPCLEYKIDTFKGVYTCRHCGQMEFRINTSNMANVCVPCTNALASQVESDTIVSIEYIAARRDVFDFKVADNRNFFAGGILVHNCDELDTLSGESRKAHKDVSGMLDSRGDKKALRVGISTRKSRYGLMNQSMENAEKEGRTVRKWTVLEFSQKCPDSRSGTNPTLAYYNQDTLEVLSDKEWARKDKVAQNEYLSAILPGEGCVACPLAALCLGDAKLQTSKSPMLKPIDDAIKKAIESGPDWAISQLFNLKPSVEGIVYKEFEEKTHVKTWNQMWRILTSADYPGECTHDIFVKKCRQLKLQCVGGVDWGWSNPSTLVVMYIDNQENVYVVRTDARTYYNNPSWVAHIKTTWHNTYGIQLYFPDLANPGDGQLMREAGLPCPDKVEKNIHDGVQVVKKWLRSLAHPLPKLFIAKETNQFLINEFGLYHFETDAAGEVTDKPSTEHDHACFVPGTMVHTISGMKPIETIEVGDLVLNRYGKYQPVNKVIIHPYVGEIIDMDFVGRELISCTPNHPFLLSKLDRCYDIDLSGRKLTGQLRPVVEPQYYQPQNIATTKRQVKGEFRYMGLMPRRPTDGQDYVIDFLDIMNKYQPPHCAKYQPIDNDKIISGNRSIRNRFLPVSNEVAFLIGYWLAEGNISGSKKQLNGISLAGHIKEQKVLSILERVKDQMGDKMTIDMKISARKPNYQGRSYHMASVKLGAFFRPMGKSIDKKPPAFVNNLPLEKRSYLLAGYMMGDGCFTKGKVRGCSISKDIAYTMYQIMVDMGYKPIMRLAERSKQAWANKPDRTHITKDQYKFSLNISDSNEFMNYITQHSDLAYVFEDKTMERTTCNMPSNKGYVDHNGSWTLLRDMTKRTYSGNVYNLEMEGDPSYVVEGVTVHNCDALRYMMFGTFGKAGLITANYGLEMANDDSTDARGHYLRAPTAAEYAKQNGLSVNEDQSLTTRKLGEVGTLAQLITEDSEEDDASGGSFLWSF